MKVIEQYFEWVLKPENVLEIIERAGRTCYKSEDKITNGSDEKFVRSLIDRGHEAMIEISIDPIVRLVTNRRVSHELVRHRHISPAQESQRYCNYSSDDIEFILPVWDEESTNTQRKLWIEACETCEMVYKDLIRNGWRPEQAGDVLPNATKTEIIIKANFREWRHIFKLRCSPKAHPQMRELMLILLKEFYIAFPVIFDDIAGQYISPETLAFLRECP